MSEPYYAIEHREGSDTLHRDPGEECTVGDRVPIDAATGRALEASGDIQRCPYCIDRQEED